MSDDGPSVGRLTKVLRQVYGPNHSQVLLPIIEWNRPKYSQRDMVNFTLTGIGECEVNVMSIFSLIFFLMQWEWCHRKQ